MIINDAKGMQFRNIPPGKDFILGTNSIGQDLWARIWAGTRTSLIIGLSVALAEAVIGITVGVIWGYVRKADFILTEIYNIIDNIPNTIVLILISYILKPSVKTLVFAMCLTGWIQMARFIRNQILIIRDRDYNVASRCLGTPVSRIILKKPASLSGVCDHAAHGPDHSGCYRKRSVYYIHWLGTSGEHSKSWQSDQRRTGFDHHPCIALSAGLPDNHPFLCYHIVLYHRQCLFGCR